jgi:peptidoglycan-associated lipoprotein
MSLSRGPRITLLIVIVTLLLVLPACHKRPPKTEPEPEPVATAVPTPTPSDWESKQAKISEEELYRQQYEKERQETLVDIHFDFDSATLSSQARQTLSKIAQWLLKHPDGKLVIEGHCDERGSQEYNLALGERRAAAAKSYLVSYGIAPNRLRTISYGEELPLDPGHNEAAWAKNRRAHFKPID